MLKTALWLESTTPNPAKKGLKYWCQDETRLGLKTIERKKITAVGVKPIGKVPEGVTRELGDRADNGLGPYTSLIKAAFMGGFTG